MNKNINNALGITESNNNMQPSGSTNSGLNNGAESTLSIIATIVLISGILLSLICLFTLTTIEVGYHKEFNPIGLGYSIMILFSTLISWSVMKVLSNISLTLKNINSKMPNGQPKAEATPQPQPATYKKLSDEERIANLKELVETGTLSQAEFDEEVARIKGEI